MKRRIAIILLLLAGGAVVNVAVAWTHSALVDPHAGARSKSAEHVDMSIGMWYFDRWDTLGSSFINAMFYPPEYAGDASPMGVQEILPYWVPNRVSFESFADVGEADFKRRFIAEARGTPLSAFWQEFEMQHLPDDGTFINIRWIVHGGIPIGNNEFAPRSIPLRPVWPGFIINTLFYALLLWLLFFAPFAARRMLRRRRGLCVKCAYPLGVSPVCTECGAAVRRRQET